MVRYFNTLRLKRLQQLISEAGLTEREFSKKLWGERTHQTLKYFIEKPDPRISRVARIAEILHCSIEDIMVDSDEFRTKSTSNFLQKDEQIINQELTALKSEIESNKELLKEKDARISDQKVYIEHLVKLLHNEVENGQSSDNDKE
ncbi:hypothetical protein [Hallella colorans]|uniref:hypothetical protein n=1 Tax=Hallella colorans TaxID=1703337 RepID=UPI00288B6379|nr:hypothetical protein [Hallella colorans]